MSATLHPSIRHNSANHPLSIQNFDVLFFIFKVNLTMGICPIAKPLLRQFIITFYAFLFFPRERIKVYQMSKGTCIPNLKKFHQAVNEKNHFKVLCGF